MSLKDQFGKDVLLTGWGHSRFGKLTGETLESLIVQVATEAIAHAGVEPGGLDPNHIVTPGVFVQRLVQATARTKDIEQRTVRPRATATAAEPVPA